MADGDERTEWGDLVRGALEGGRRGLEELCRALDPVVGRLCARVLGRSDWIEDAAQETFVRLIRGLKRYDPERPLIPWVQRIAVNVCYDLLRRRKYEGVRLVAEVPSKDEDRSLKGAVYEGLDRLTPQERVVFVMKDLEEWETADVAKELEIGESTARAHLARAREKMREFLRKQGYP